MVVECGRLAQLHPSLSQLQRLQLIRVRSESFSSISAAVALQAVVKMRHLRDVHVQVEGASAEDLALLQQLPQLRLLGLRDSHPADSALRGLTAVTGLQSLDLEGISLSQLQPALPLLLQLLCLRAHYLQLGPATFSLLAQLTQLQHLEVSPLYDPEQRDPFRGINQLSRLRQLTELVGDGWQMANEDVVLLENPSLRVLRLDNVASAAGSRPLQSCGVTQLVVDSLWSYDGKGDNIPAVLLPRVARLECYLMDALDFEPLLQFSSLTDLKVFGYQASSGGLTRLPGLPLLHRLLLIGYKLTDESLVVGLQGCSSLVHLGLECWREGITEQGLLRLVAALPSLRSLALNEDCGVTTSEGRWEACNMVALRSGGPFAWQPERLRAR